MTRDAILVISLIVSAYYAVERARGARLLRRTAKWPTADRAELGRLTLSYIARSAAYALAAITVLAALIVRHA